MQRLPLQDFDAEVRPSVDVKQFLEQSVVVLDEDVEQTSPVDLVELLLGKMQLSATVIEEAKGILFTHDTGMP